MRKNQGVRFGILGSTQAGLPDGRPVAVGGPGVRVLLARLLAEAGQVVGTRHLIDARWRSTITRCERL
ncbi:hypothetical protein AB0M95_08160 [Sphaerisporangium sp. NPDC051017]|uniref:hypothetical protein n=1 Tax=Sphaerisporangium sp. NPDC051017 TaxID=3154636 RepID=UPI00342AA43E